MPAGTDVIFGRALGDRYCHLAPALSSVVAKHDGAEDIYLRQDLKFVPGARQRFLGPIPAVVESCPVLQPPSAFVAATAFGAYARNTLFVSFAGMKMPIRTCRSKFGFQPLCQLVCGRPRRPTVTTYGHSRPFAECDAIPAVGAGLPVGAQLVDRHAETVGAGPPIRI